MGVHPIYYRQSNDFYPQDAKIFTQKGAFPLELECYLGQAGADSVKILNHKDDLRNSYDPFLRYQKDYEYVDYTKPSTVAFHTTFIAPASFGKKTLKSKGNKLAPYISLIAGIIIFASLYLLVRDCKTIINSVKLIQKSKYIQKFLSEVKDTTPGVALDPVYKNLYKVSSLREKIYKRNLISSVISLAMTVALIAVSLFAIVTAIMGAYPLLIGAAVTAGILVIGHCIKTIIEWKGRLDKGASKEILENTEALKKTNPAFTQDKTEHTFQFIKERPYAYQG